MSFPDVNHASWDCHLSPRKHGTSMRIQEKKIIQQTHIISFGEILPTNNILFVFWWCLKENNFSRDFPLKIREKLIENKELKQQ